MMYSAVETQRSSPALWRSAHACDGANGYPGAAVVLNVYDITEANGLLGPLGVGVYHCGVEVYGTEVHYGRCAEGTGIGRNPPRRCDPHLFAEQYVLGTTALTPAQVERVLAELEADGGTWDGTRYHLVRHNCIHFAEILVARLLPGAAGQPLPTPDAPAAWEAGAGCLPPALAYWLGVDAGGPLPPHVQRIARSALAYLPGSVVDMIDSWDGSAPVEE